MTRTGWPKTQIFVRVNTIVRAPEGTFLSVRIPGFDMTGELLLPKSLFPESLFDLLSVSPGPRDCRIALTAWAKLSGETLDPLDLTGPWEMTKGPDFGGWTNQDRRDHYKWDTAGNALTN